MLIPIQQKAGAVSNNQHFLKYMDIWHVENKEWTKLRLLCIQSTHFRVIEAGNFRPILTNATYTLIDNRYSPVFNSLRSQVLITPIKIHDFSTKTKSDDYVELKIFNDISPETINTLDSTGKKLWKCYGDLFVSGNLKRELFKISGDELTFSLGFSMFGGINSNAHNIGF